MEEEYERVVLVKPEVFVYKIPPRATNRGVRAADWKLDCPDWTGRLRIVAKGKECILKLEDKMTGDLFAKSPIDKYPGVAIEAVADSSRYFVVRLQDDDGKTAFIGIGFADRGDSFDVNVALQDHFKWLQKNEEIEKETIKQETSSQPQLDLGFKEGQTITINMNIAKKSGYSKSKAKGNAGTAGGLGFGLLPPPPGSHKVPGPPSAKNSPPAPSPTGAESTSILSTSAPSSGAEQSAIDLLGLLSLDSESAPAASPAPELGLTATPVPASTGVATNGQNIDLWGDFASAQNASNASSTTTAQNWVQF